MGFYCDPKYASSSCADVSLNAYTDDLCESNGVERFDIGQGNYAPFALKSVLFCSAFTLRLRYHLVFGIHRNNGFGFQVFIIVSI